MSHHRIGCTCCACACPATGTSDTLMATLYGATGCCCAPVNASGLTLLQSGSTPQWTVSFAGGGSLTVYCDSGHYHYIAQLAQAPPATGCTDGPGAGGACVQVGGGVPDIWQAKGPLNCTDPGDPRGTFTLPWVSGPNCSGSASVTLVIT